LLALLINALIAPQLALWDEASASIAWKLADDQRLERRIILVDIDERSTQAIGPWPWPRERQAELLEKLNAAGVSLKMLDILFEGNRPGDVRLARALETGAPTIQAQLFSLDPNITIRSGQLGNPLPFGSVCPQPSEAAHGYMASDTALTPNPSRPPSLAGHITPLIDPDGTIRQVPALICFEGRSYATLAVAGLLAASEATPKLWQEDHLLAPAWWLELGAARLPLDRQGHLRVSYQMPRNGFLSLSALDILENRVPAELLKDAWVLIGATAFGARDVVPTPLGRAVSGIEVHAQILSALLDGRSPYRPQGAPLWPWLAGGLGALLLLLALRLAPRAPHLALPLATLINLTALFAASSALLLNAHLWLGWTTPALFLLLAATLLGVAEYARSRFERERLYRNLASYLPEPVARQIATHEPIAQVQATRREATILHADLRNFSAYCEGRPPEETAMVLHLFFTTASRIVEAHGGVVEQMVGDSLLAVWNGSRPNPAHTTHALQAAADLWRTCAPQLPHIESDDTPPLDLGIGLETGSVLIGSFGSAERRTHTVLGEAVTVATRLQALTGELAYPILIGPSLALAQRKHTALHRLGDFLLTGLARPHSVYALPIELPPSRLHLVHTSQRNAA
jgi:adenylate cyclase